MSCLPAAYYGNLTIKICGSQLHCTAFEFIKHIQYRGFMGKQLLLDEQNARVIIYQLYSKLLQVVAGREAPGSMKF